MTKRGTLNCQLLKALFSCVQVSKLWYNKLTRFFYEQLPTYPCIMRKIVGKEVFLLIIYVDDILVLASEPEIERLQHVFIKQFRWITMEIGNPHSYLGMQLILGDGCVRVSMRNFIEKMLLSSGEDDLKEYKSLAGKDFFKVHMKSEV